MGVQAPQGCDLHRLPLATGEPRHRCLHELSQRGCVVVVQTYLVLEVLLVPPVTIRALQRFVRFVPFPNAVVVERALLAPIDPRRRTLLPELRLRVVPPSRVHIGIVPEVPRQQLR